MNDIIKTYDQYLLDSGKWAQAEVFANSCEFLDIQIDVENLRITANTKPKYTKEDVITTVYIDENHTIQFECTCEREKPCMHGMGLFLHAKYNDLFLPFKDKLAEIPSKTIEELIEEENLNKLNKIHYKIITDEETEVEEKYSFDCTIIDDKENTFSSALIKDHIKVVGDHCVFYTQDGNGFYADNNDFFKRILRVILSGQKYSKTDTNYTIHLINMRLKRFVVLVD